MNKEEKDYFTNFLLKKLNCSYEDEDLIHKKMFLLHYLGVKVDYEFIWDNFRGVYSPELDDYLDDRSANRPPQREDDSMLDCALDRVCIKVNNLHLEAMKRKVKVDPRLWYHLVADTVFLRITLPKDKVIKTISKMNIPGNTIDIYHAVYLTARQIERKR